MTKIVALSDQHMNFFDVPEGDILIVAGDMTYRGQPSEVKAFSIWLESQKSKFKHRIFIAGNHDFGFQDNKDEMISYFDEDVIYLEHEACEVEGIKIFGSPYTPPFYNWAFMRNEYILERLYGVIPDDTELLITHGPPHRILDQVPSGEQAGSYALYDRIKSLKKLKHHIFGHIHTQGGKHEQIFGVNFYNVAVLNDAYKQSSGATVIEL